MESNQNDYHISFFKPTTTQAKWNRNLAIKLILIWAIAVFGFHFLLKIVEKPTPEQAYTNYEKVWQNILNENASTEELKTFAHSSLSVLGKVFIKPDQKKALQNALSYTAFTLADSSDKITLKEAIVLFETQKAETSSISSAEYIDAKNALSDIASPILGLEKNDVRTKIVSGELISSQLEEFKVESKELIPETMSTYLIHNQSFLTDFKFLGFPFHYFYTAVFLLVLFVFLCWLYCVRVDKMNIELDIDE